VRRLFQKQRLDGVIDPKQTLGLLKKTCVPIGRGVV